MTDNKGKTSKQKIELIKYDRVTKGNGKYVELVYKRLDGDDAGKEAKTGAFESTLDNDSKEVIKTGGQMVITKTSDGKFWPLTKVENISTWTDKPYKKPYDPNWKAAISGVVGKSEYNNAGAKVGGVLHDAVALAGKGASIEAVKELAEKLLHLSYELEGNVSDGKYKPGSSQAVKYEADSFDVEEAEEPEDF